MEILTFILCIWTLTLSIIYLIDLSEFKRSRDRFHKESVKLHLENRILCRKVKELLSVDWYWDNNCLESSAETLEDALREYDIGDVVELRPVHELMKIYVVRDDTGNEAFTTQAAADEAAEKWNNE